MLEFRVLGPLQVAREGRLLPLGGIKQRGLLALLLLDRNRVVPRDRLVDALWGEEPPQSAANSIQVYVSKLRRLLDEGEPGTDGALVTEPPGYRLCVPPGEVDADEFERLVAAGTDAVGAGSFDEAEATLSRALALWRGPALADLAPDFAQAAITRLEGLRLQALEARFEAMLAVGREAEAVGELQALVALHPLDERLRAQLMLALYRSGRQADALETYRSSRRLLTEELGLEPSPELRALEQSILRQDESLGRRETPAQPAAAAPARAEPREDERRPVTVLFADIVGSTMLGERLAPDEVKVLVGECVTMMSRAVEEYGGTVQAYQGDGICAYFGVPAAHEDDPERAARAALRIHEVIRGYADDIERAWGISGFAVRVGVNSGPAAVGLVGTADPQIVALGDATNVAARLQAAAEPGDDRRRRADRTPAGRPLRPRTVRRDHREGEREARDRVDPRAREGSRGSRAHDADRRQGAGARAAARRRRRSRRRPRPRRSPRRRAGHGEDTAAEGGLGDRRGPRRLAPRTLPFLRRPAGLGLHPDPARLARRRDRRARDRDQDEGARRSRRALRRRAGRRPPPPGVAAATARRALGRPHRRRRQPRLRPLARGARGEATGDRRRRGCPLGGRADARARRGAARAHRPRSRRARGHRGADHRLRGSGPAHARGRALCAPDDGALARAAVGRRQRRAADRSGRARARHRDAHAPHPGGRGESALPRGARTGLPRGRAGAARPHLDGHGRLARVAAAHPGEPPRRSVRPATRRSAQARPDRVGDRPPLPGRGARARVGRARRRGAHRAPARRDGP